MQITHALDAGVMFVRVQVENLNQGYSHCGSRLSTRLCTPAVPATFALAMDKLLSDAQMRRFLVDGFIVIRPDLPDDFHELIFRQTESVFESEGNPGNNLLPRIPDLQQLLDSAVVHGALTSVLGEDYYTQPHRHCHFNQPGSDGQKMHQDGGRRWSHLTRRLLMFYYPQDTPVKLGPTGIVPGSHYYATEHGAAIVDEMPLIGDAGTVAIVNYDLFHRAMPNRTDDKRYMMKFLFSRMSEPEAPSWQHESRQLPAHDSDTLSPNSAREDQRGMFEYAWDWHHGSTNDADSTATDARPPEPDLVDKLRDDSETTRLAAAYALSGSGADAVPVLVKLLDDESENVRRDACHALSALGPAAVEPLIDALRHPSDLARDAAAETLGDIGLAARTAVPALLECIEDESADVREHAAEALGTVCQSESAAVPGLASALSDTHEKVRRSAAFSLARLGPHAEEATEALRGVLYDENRYVRGDATQALLRIGTSRSIAAIVPYLETSRWCPLTTKDSTF